MNCGVIFDLDGVIVDSGEFHFQAWQALGHSVSKEFTHEYFLQTFGMTNDMILSELLGPDASAEEKARLAGEKEVLYRDSIRGQIKPLPGVMKLLRALKNDWWKVALGTSAPKENVELMFEELKLGQFFDAVSKDGDYERGKPDPGVFLAAQRMLGILPNECVVIEDAPVGVEAAKNAGMRCVAVLTTNSRESLAKADLIVETLEEVKPRDLLSLLEAAI